MLLWAHVMCSPIQYLLDHLRQYQFSSHIYFSNLHVVATLGGSFVVEGLTSLVTNARCVGGVTS